MKIYYNPQCSKCRIALKLLQESGKEIEVIEYLKTGLTKEIVSKFYDNLGSEILRKKDLIEQIEMNKENIIKVIIENPKLLQRPILVDGNKMIIGREEDKVREFIQ